MKINYVSAWFANLSKLEEKCSIPEDGISNALMTMVEPMLWLSPS